MSLSTTMMYMNIVDRLTKEMCYFSIYCKY